MAVCSSFHRKISISAWSIQKSANYRKSIRDENP